MVGLRPVEAIVRRIKLVLGLLVGLAIFGTTTASFAQAVRSRTKPATAAPRQWSDVTGKFKIRATLVEQADGQVQLKKTDGSVISVPIEKLSELDRKWLLQQEAAAGEESSGAEWPGFRGPNRNGKSPDTGLLKQWPSGGPPLLWKVDVLGEGFSSPSIANGTVYATGERDGTLTLFAFDLEGKLKWKTAHGPAWTENYPGARSSPTIDGQKVYVLSGKGTLGCFDAQSGRRLWARDAKEFGGQPGGWGYAESPLVLGNQVIFKPGGNNCIVALEKAGGKPVWSSSGFSAGPEYSSCLAFTLGNQTMIVTGTNQGLVCVDARRGSRLWSNPFSANNTANCPTPDYADGHVFWANGYGKGGVCMRLEPGGKATEAWKTGDMVCHHGGYVIHEGYIYGNNENGWSCLDLKTGKTQWKERGVGKGSLCWADDMLYLFSESGGRAALATCSPQGLEIKGEVRVEGKGPSWAHPVVIGGRLYLRYDTNLYCYDVRDQK